MAMYIASTKTSNKINRINSTIPVELLVGMTRSKLSPALHVVRVLHAEAILLVMVNVFRPHDGILLIRYVERIHSGVRPHMCEHPGCKKQFIQRSALTVHARVHTGEKPHMCERCSKVILSTRHTLDDTDWLVCSLLAIPVLLHGIVAYILVNDPTSVHLQIVKRHLRGVPLWLAIRTIILVQ